MDFATDQAAENGIELNCQKVNFQQISEEVTTAITRSYNILSRVEVLPGQPPITRFLSPVNQDVDFVPLSMADCHIIFEGIKAFSDQPNGNYETAMQKKYLASPTVTLTELEQTTIASSIISFDIDSFLALPQSLAVVKRGLRVFNIASTKTDIY